MRRLIVVSLVLLAALIWWLFLDSRAPKTAGELFDIEAYRALIAEDENLPASVRVEIVGRDLAPAFAVETGGGFQSVAMVYTAFQIPYAEGTVVIGAAADAITAAEIAQSPDAVFEQQAYDRLIGAIKTADDVYITHEHLDHVMAITRHPEPSSIADNLRLTAPQITALPQFAPPGETLAPALQNLAPVVIDKPERIAPGLVAAPMPGHTEGSLVFFVRRADGAEYLLIGDIVWNASNIANLKTRPRLLQYLFFEPNEDRKAVLRQVRALHDLAKAEPDLIILPDHDGALIDSLIADGKLTEGFTQEGP